MVCVLFDHRTYLKLLKAQHTHWIKFSVVFVIMMILIEYFWTEILELDSHLLWYIITAVLISVAALWWYWTMYSVAAIIADRDNEILVLRDIIKSIQQVKDEILELKHQ